MAAFDRMIQAFGSYTSPDPKQSQTNGFMVQPGIPAEDPARPQTGGGFMLPQDGRAVKPFQESSNEPFFKGMPKRENGSTLFDLLMRRSMEETGAPGSTDRDYLKPAVMPNPPRPTMPFGMPFGNRWRGRRGGY